MTQKEIDKFLYNIKVYVNGKSKEIQEKLFKLGYSWGEYNSYNVIHTKYPFLYIDNNKLLSYDTDMDYFMEHRNREITADEILSLELTEPKYRPFKTQEECWNEMLKHQPFGWVIIQAVNEYRSLSTIGKNRDFGLMFDTYTFADGTPFGIKED